MITDIPCACAYCGVVYANARAITERPYAAPEEFLDSAHGNSFAGRYVCRVCGSVNIEGVVAPMYRLLAGPLYVPRA